MRRGRLAVACNLDTDPVTVRVTGDVVLAWGEPLVTAEHIVLPAHSFAILRAVDN